VVGYWLIGSAVSVFGIVVWGGLTRLTESGYVNAMVESVAGANEVQPEHHGMETRHGLPAAHVGR
jgi:hypothetical protein